MVILTTNRLGLFLGRNLRQRAKRPRDSRAKRADEFPSSNVDRHGRLIGVASRVVLNLLG